MLLGEDTFCGAVRYGGALRGLPGLLIPPSAGVDAVLFMLPRPQ